MGNMLRFTGRSFSETLCVSRQLCLVCPDMMFNKEIKEDAVQVT
jgi:hypothetical protein